MLYQASTMLHQAACRVQPSPLARVTSHRLDSIYSYTRPPRPLSLPLASAALLVHQQPSRVVLEDRSTLGDPRSGRRVVASLLFLASPLQDYTDALSQSPQGLDLYEAAPRGDDVTTSHEASGGGTGRRLAMYTSSCAPTLPAASRRGCGEDTTTTTTVL